MPRNTSLNWFMPALVKSNVGSSAGTSEELRTTRWPRAAKYSRNFARMSFPVIFFSFASGATMMALRCVVE